MISFLSFFFITSASAQPEMLSIDSDAIKRKPWRFADKMGYIDMVELDGLVEVPLFRKKQTIFEVYIEVNTTDPKKAKETEDSEEDAPKPSFFKLDLSSNIIAVDDAFVQANGLDVKQRIKN